MSHGTTQSARASVAHSSSFSSMTASTGGVTVPARNISPNISTSYQSGGSRTPSLHSMSPASLPGISPFTSTDNSSRSSSSKGDQDNMPVIYLPESPAATQKSLFMASPSGTPRSRTSKKSTMSDASVALAKAKARNAKRMNDSLVYLDGPQVYTCGQCRTHLTSHDDIISKSFHGRHGRAYLFDQCVNVIIGPSEDRQLITGLHSVCDIFCKRCKGMIGWTYTKAYDHSQKYKEGKYIIEKIHLHLDESDCFDVSHPAGERPDRWRLRSMSWGSERSLGSGARMSSNDIVFEYQAGIPRSPRTWESPAQSSTRSQRTPSILRLDAGGDQPTMPPSAPSL